MKVGGVAMISALAIALPILVVVVAGKLMVEVSGRDRIAQSIIEEGVTLPEALQSRYYGYDAPEAKAYWDALGKDGLVAERRLLQFDLLFPLLYGTALAFSTVALWWTLEIRVSLAWFLIPAVAAIIADWIETTILLQQLRNFDTTGILDSGQIKVASIATVTKSFSIALSAVLIISFAVALLVRGATRQSGGTNVPPPETESVG